MKEETRSEGGMREVTPGKLVSKNTGTVWGFSSRVVKCLEGRKSVQVKDPSYIWSDSRLEGERRTYVTGYRDEHEFLPWPDMQMIW